MEQRHVHSTFEWIQAGDSAHGFPVREMMIANFDMQKSAVTIAPLRYVPQSAQARFTIMRAVPD
jgi:hypothetical protein